MWIVEPSSRLSPYIKAFMVIESDDILVNRLLPDTSIVLAIRYKGTVHYKKEHEGTNLPVFSISGLRKTARLVQYGKDTGNILVQFKEAGAAAFLKSPVHELFESNLALNHFFNISELEELEEQIHHTETIDQKIKIVEQFLIARLRYQKPDLLVAASIQKIHAAKGLLRMKQLADSLYISTDAFEKRFRKLVGTTPKQFAAIVRMNSVIAQGHLDEPLVNSALNAGFFDQSHFIKDFKTFTGQTPTEFFGSTAKL
ncbi:helix-turn-helix domain-containing protein [Mucilaginibacter sp. X4EP1]|uniref:helix-turn-helix transcriptional regulator n=1 Tax=Mucilaginibacter sp. X4EP1 TaxID=2723092 RepID=UPI002168FCEB|nr:helix-turn-helix transcriptional regulator [Mucilaginibacter sp. X4EP1]MCS3811533.1 AraC-like DNA-binding protein [Mucilaginibacter sp. X4EP1]